MDLQRFEQILEAKHDLSYERYQAGWPELLDRYDITAALVREGKVLDIGCAQGVLGWLLRDREDIQYTGVDASQTMINQARDLFDLYFRCAYAEDLPFAAGEFDTVVMGQVLEHVMDAAQAAAEALRVLKPGGRLIVDVPANEEKPHGNHLRVFATLNEMTGLFPGIRWDGEGRVHRYWYAWGEKV